MRLPVPPGDKVLEMAGSSGFPKKRMVLLAARLVLCALLYLLYLGLERHFDRLDLEYGRPVRIVFSQPMPESIREKYNIKNEYIEIERVYVAGGFSNWDPADPLYRMERVSENSWEISLTFHAGLNPYKFVIYPKNAGELPGWSKGRIWCQDGTAKIFEDDRYGGLNSVIEVKSTKTARFLAGFAILSLGGGILAYIVLAALIRFLMTRRCSLRLKLLVVTAGLLVLVNLLFIHYAFRQQQDTIAKMQRDSVNTLHAILLGQGVDFVNPREDDLEKMRTLFRQCLAVSSPAQNFDDFSNEKHPFRTLLFADPGGRMLARADHANRKDWFLARLKTEEAIEAHFLKTTRLAVQAHVARHGASRDVRFSLWEEYTGGDLDIDDEEVDRLKGRYAYYASNLLVCPVYVKMRHVGYYLITFSQWSYNALIGETLHFNLALLAIILLLYALLLLGVGRLILTPLHALIAGIDEVRQGNLGHALAISTGDEIESLGDAYNVMRDGLRENDRLKKQFLANTSHELRTPINGIIGLAEAMLEEGGAGLSEQAGRHLGMIRESAANLKKLVDNILDYSKLTQAGMELEPDVFPVRMLFDKVAASVSGLFINKPVRFTIEDPGGLQVYADPEKAQQVLINLVGNANKFTAQGRVILRASFLEAGDLVLFQVEDSGIGIAKENLEVIFEEFHQLDGEAGRNYEGTGLGLAISRQLVESHGGRIWAESVPGNGSVFSFTLPASPREHLRRAECGPALPVAPAVFAVAVDQVKETEPARARLPRGDGELLLAVDDNRINLEILATRLGRNNWRVETVTGGEEALEAYQRLSPDLVLLDVMMPGMDGFEVCRRIRQERREEYVPVVFLTAKQQKDDKIAGISAGGDDFISKPFDMEELIIRIASHLRVRRMQELLREKDLVDQELRVAGGIQRTLQPKVFPDTAHFAAYGGTAAARGIGGDYFDVLDLGKDRYLCLVADVSGKGPAAALIMVKVQTLVHSSIKHAGFDMPALCSEIDLALEQEFGGNRFLSLVMILLDLPARRFSYVNAGHPGGLHLTRQGTNLRPIPVTASLLGVAAVRMPWDEKLVRQGELASGDAFILYSDGITDMRNVAGEFFGEERLNSLVVKNGLRPPQALYATIMAEVVRHGHGQGQGQGDDMTLLILRVK